VGGGAEGEEEADSLLSREPNAGLDPRHIFLYNTGPVKISENIHANYVMITIPTTYNEEKTSKE